MELTEAIVDQISTGVLVVDRHLQICVWNRFLEIYSGRSASQVVGKNLLEVFPELPKEWLARKLRAITVLKSEAFTSWEQRPYLLRFEHQRFRSRGVEFMRQDCAFFPVLGPSGEVEHIAITITDATETFIAQTALNQALARLEEQSQIDVLSGIYNRRKLEEHLTYEIKRAARYKSSLSMIIFDIDHFKKVNDTHGHLAGDAVIRQVAQLIRSTLRSTDLAARYGGEEFAVVLGDTALGGALTAAERIRCVVEDTSMHVGDLQLKVTLSGGIAVFHPGMEGPEDLIRDADAGLYASKQGGRNRTTFLAKGLDKAPVAGLRLEGKAGAQAPLDPRRA